MYLVDFKFRFKHLLIEHPIILYRLSVTTSVFPVPSICAQDQIQDWFDSLADCLQWNVRKRQRTFDESDDIDVSSSDSYEIMEN